MKHIKFLDNNGTFRMEQVQEYSGLYFPIAGENGLKCAVTPNLNGDSKTDHNHFLLQPVSVEDLHNNKSGRNFWCRMEDGTYFSAVGASAGQQSKLFTEAAEEVSVEAGIMWHKVTRKMGESGLQAEVLSFIPVGGNTEVMQVSLCNISEEPKTFVPIGAIPIYGRSADNLRDHRHVTSLLHRGYTTENGVFVKPVLSFDERGHEINETVYYVIGADGNGEAPESFFPSVESFIGEGGSLEVPKAVVKNMQGCESDIHLDGYEALGGIRFAKTTLQPGEEANFLLFLGMEEMETSDKGLSERAANINQDIIGKYGSTLKLIKVFEHTKNHWLQEMNVAIGSGDINFDQYMKWISFQPVLRRIYGCSFLPHHDYGKGGRGWRDLWQDQLALLMMNPKGVGSSLLNHYGGVRMDGSNATIIGSRPGEFIADRNNITRVWMDHALWPFITTNLYIQQTGDLNLLFQEVSYFKDKQVFRGNKTDDLFEESQGTTQRTDQGEVYYGTVLEHILLQNLTAFYEVGEHNHMRLRGADWNDALDMAEERGESVAFTAAYAGNFEKLAEVLEFLKEDQKLNEVELLEEILPLLEDSNSLYEDIDAKNTLLNRYCKSVEHKVSGCRKKIAIDTVITSLRQKAQWLKKHINRTEWLSEGWFNSYYDNYGQPVEGIKEDKVRMMLTGQVFAIMSGTADPSQIKQMTKNADTYLYDAKRGGYCLNTDFEEVKTDLGRMFGFAYGHKENGAVFSHMTTMYGYALYQQGFSSEGYKALDTLYRQAANVESSRIYPGIPEYFNDNGRGMYHYLTGAASWYLLTVITQMFGVRGYYGDLILEPKLMAEQFDGRGEAKVSLLFAGRKLTVIYRNREDAEYGEYAIDHCMLDGVQMPDGKQIKASVLEALSETEEHILEVELKGI